MSLNFNEMSKEQREKTIALFIEHNKPLFVLIAFTRQEFEGLKVKNKLTSSKRIKELRKILDGLLQNFIQMKLPVELEDILTADLKTLIMEMDETIARIK